MFEKPSKLRVALISGGVIGAVSAVPGISLINCCCCAGVWLGGVLAVYLYKQQMTDEMPPLESSDALMLGLMAGVTGAFVATILNVLILFTLGPLEAELVQSIFGGLLEKMAEQGSLSSEMADMMKEQFEQSVKDAGRLSNIFGGLFITLIIYPIFTILGALLGITVFKKKSPPQTTTA